MVQKRLITKGVLVKKQNRIINKLKNIKHYKNFKLNLKRQLEIVN